MSGKTWSAIVLAAAVAASATTAAWAESVWVQNDNTNILGGKGSIYPTVANVKKGTELQVMAREGKWVQVQIAGGQAGWVHESALSPRKVGADLLGGIRGDDASGLSTGAAARGWGAQTEQYVSSKGMSKAGMDRLLAIKKSISPAEWEAFDRSVRTAAANPASPTPPMQPQPAPVPVAPVSPPGVMPPANRPPAYTPPPAQPPYTPQPVQPRPAQPYTPQPPR